MILAVLLAAPEARGGELACPSQCQPIAQSDAPESAADSEKGRLVFVEVAEQAGLTFRHGALGDTPGAAQHGSGTVGDFNGDGWPDLFFPGGGDELDGLFINNRDGTFTDRAEAWGLTGSLYRGVGANAADFNDDGTVDLYVSSLGNRPGIRNGEHRLYRNNGDGTFTDVAVAAGVHATAPDFVPDGYAPVWGDYDLDGDLDLWVGGWQNGLAPDFPTTRLFRNDGGESFTDVTAAAGIETLDLNSFGAVFADMDGDRYPEILVAADFGTSRYFVNNRDGTFSSITPGVGPEEKVHNGMGTTVGDFDRDGRLDWFVTAIYPAWDHAGPPGNRLYLNRSRGVGDHDLLPLPATGGVNDGGWGWGVAAVDLDHDGWLDLVHTAGWEGECPATQGRCYESDPVSLFRNNGDGTFTDLAAASGLVHTGQGRGLLQLDYDRDGDMDIIIVENNGPVFLFRNDLTGEGTNWLKVELDTRAAPDLAPHGIGARVEIRAGGGHRQLRYINTGSNYLGSGELTAHFGLGEIGCLDQVVVHWPDGSRSVRANVRANRHLRIVAGEEPALLPPATPCPD